MALGGAPCSDGYRSAVARCYVQVSFDAPDMGMVAEGVARGQIVNRLTRVGGLGWISPTPTR